LARTNGQIRIPTMRATVLSLLLSLPLLAACSGTAESAAPAAKAKAIASSAEAPVVVELFQSQGCSSCPPANAALNKLADRSDVIALSFAVDYWDRLGWKDIFAQPAFTQRQRDYAAALKGGSVYTPQVVINGTRELVGNGKGELAQAVAASKGISGGPMVNVSSAKASIGTGSGNGTVWLVRYDPSTHNVAIRAGENGGRTLPHRNIVRELTKLGSWNGKATSYNVPASKDSALKTVVILQQGLAGPVLGVGRG
jgi:hypothetical protein